MRVRVINSYTTQENLEKQSASFYEHPQYYRGLLADYDGVIIKQECKKTGDTRTSGVIDCETFLEGLRPFMTFESEGLYYRW
jgi:hypothetical protein